MTDECIKIAAVIATKNRPYELQNISLPSVLSQSKKPTYIVIVDDSDLKYRHINEEISISLKSSGIKVIYLENYRTPGACGAWNTAFDWLMRKNEEFYIAILDDDDYWDPDYLNKCYRSASDHTEDMVISGIIRYDDDHPSGLKLSIPTHLDLEELLWKNPHIQGSNLFVRLEVLLEAGGFDEALTGTTDRDLCIRIADLDYVKYGVVNEWLVHHNASSSSDRISSKGSPRKLKGLDRFYKKYKGRMNNQVHTNFLNRSYELFNWNPPEEMIDEVHLKDQALIQIEPVPLKIIIGSITSPQIFQIKNLLRDINNLRLNCPNISFRVLLLENSGTEIAIRKELANFIQQITEQGLETDFITHERQQSDVQELSELYSIEMKHDRMEIASSRTLLQLYLQLSSRMDPDAIVWILDDDSRFENLIFDGNGYTNSEIDFNYYCKEIKDAKNSIILGTITGEPPLPFSSCIRTQMVDLYHNLAWFSSADPSSPYPNRIHENQHERNRVKDFYYDLSHWETDHLETPFWYVPLENGLSNSEVLKELFSRIIDIFDGIEVFRPLVFDNTTLAHEKKIPSIYRGGNTFIIDLDSLRLFPNIVPTFGANESRRSDMVWCILNKFVGGRSVFEIPLPIRQERTPSHSTDVSLDLTKLRQDMQGFAFYSALHDLCIQKAREKQKDGQPPRGEDFLNISKDEAHLFVERYLKHLTERLLTFELNSYRVRGLIKIISRQLERPSWWTEDPNFKEVRMNVQNLLESLKSEYTKQRLDTFKKDVMDVDSNYLFEFIMSLGESINKYRDYSTEFPPSLIQRIQDFIAHHFSVTNSLRKLGQGAEGIVFTDGNWVYKYFHYWKAHERYVQIDFLSSIVHSFGETKSFYNLQEFRVIDGKAVLVYPYMKGVEYEGDHLHEIITFLRECRQIKIACTNVHPSNFHVTEEGLKFIDYGSDLRPYSEAYFESMCRKAYLMYRFHNWSRLKSLMTKSIRSRNLPELFNYEHFRRAVDPRSILEILDHFILIEINRLSPNKILDFGSGDGRFAEILAHQGYDVVCYDNDSEVVEIGKQRRPELNFMDLDSLKKFISEGNSFDLILLNRVVCTLESDTEVSEILTIIRSFVSEDGRVLVNVCNPFYSESPSSEFQSRIVKSENQYRMKYQYEKLLWNGSSRTDIHRPLNAYKRQFQDSNLQLENMKESIGSDVENFIPNSDFLLMELKPGKVFPKNVSVLIKSCAMEWHWIEEGIRHLVRQLKKHGHILEIVVVTDDFADTFLRQYAVADFEKHKEILER